MALARRCLPAIFGGKNQARWEDRFRQAAYLLGLQGRAAASTLAQATARALAATDGAPFDDQPLLVEILVQSAIASVRKAPGKHYGAACLTFVAEAGASR